MKIEKRVIGIILILALVSLPLVLTMVTHAQDQSGDSAAILAKLDQILNNQRSLLDQMASMREELNIIKIRVTQAQ